MSTPLLTKSPTATSRLFCMRALSLGVQIAMIGTGFGTIAHANDAPIIKRTRHATHPPTTPQTIEQSHTNHYTNGTDNLTMMSVSQKFTTLTNNDSHEPPFITKHNTSTNTDENLPFAAVNFDAIKQRMTEYPNHTQTNLTDTAHQAQSITKKTTNHYDNPLSVLTTPPTTDLENHPKTITSNPSSTEPILYRQTPYDGIHFNPQSHLSLNSLYKRPKNSCQGVWHYPSVTNPSPNGGLSASADYGYYDNEQYGELFGDVQILQNDKSIFANKVQLNTHTGQATATGQVLFNSGNAKDGKLPVGARPLTNQQKLQENLAFSNDLIGMAQKLDYNLNTGQATAYDVAFASNNLHAHGYAKGLNATNPNQTILTKTSFSACPPDRRHWELSADEIILNKETGRGIAKNTALKIRNKTIIKLPYFNFPIDDKRASGFLLPKGGINSQDGVEVSLPYYFNLAPNYDATITPTIYSNKNPRVTGEFRYLTKNYGSGIVEGAVLPNDRQYGNKNRGHLFYNHLWQINNQQKQQLGINGAHWLDDVTLTGTYHYISDNQYLSDFDNLGLTNNALNLPRRIQLTYDKNNIHATFKAETFQKLEGFDENGNPLLDKDRPYSRLPQLSINYQLPQSLTQKYLANLSPNLAKNTIVTGTHDFGYFKKRIEDNSDTEKSGFRAYNQFTMSYPLTRSWGFVIPKIALSHLYMAYDEDSITTQNLPKTEGSYAVFSPNLSIDSGLHFQKNGVPFGWLDKESGGYQLLSPRLKYQYNAYQDQSKMPNFETSTASLSYDQLLSDGWFLGYDRLSDLHAITPALNYRYIDKTGQTRLEMGIAEQFFLSNMKVGLNNSSSVLAHKGESSGLSWKASIMPYQSVWIDGAGSFKRDYTPNATMVSARYQPNDGTLFNIGVISRKADVRLGQLPLSAYTGAGVFRINNHWQVVGQAQYDTHKSRLMDTLLGINYEDCCVGISIYGRQYYNDLRPNEKPNRAIMAELRLNGLTGKGQLNRLLSEKILGFDNIAETWRQHKFK